MQRYLLGLFGDMFCPLRVFRRGLLRGVVRLLRRLLVLLKYILSLTRSFLFLMRTALHRLWTSFPRMGINGRWRDVQRKSPVNQQLD